MSSKEHLWRNRTTKEVSLDQEAQQLSIPIGVFIDDEDVFAEAWETCFRIPGVTTLRPEIPEFLTDENQKEVNQKIITFAQEITDEQLKRVALVVVDQFYDMKEVRKAITELITRLRQVNKEAFILETSGDPDGLVYPEANAVLRNALWPSDVQALLEAAPALPLVRLQAIQTYSNTAFIQAGLADPAFKGSKHFDREITRKRSFERLEACDEFYEVIKMLAVKDSSLLEGKFSKMQADQQRLFLHYTWNIIGHLQLENGAEFFGTSVARLKKLLGVE